MPTVAEAEHAGKSLAWSWGGLSVAWLLSAGSLLPLTWPLAVSALPGLAFGLFVVQKAAAEGAPPLTSDFCIIYAGFGWLCSLPVLLGTGSWWIFLFMEVFVCSTWTCAAIMRTETDVVSTLRAAHFDPVWVALLFTAVSLSVLLPVLALWASADWEAPWTCDHAPGPICESWPWPALLSPLLVAAITFSTEFVSLHVTGRFCLKRGDLLARALVLVALAATPVACMWDLESDTSWVEAPDLNLLDYVHIANYTGPWYNSSMLVNVQAGQWLRKMPEPVWPNATELLHPAPHRADFWVSYMLTKFGLVVAGAVLLLLCTCGRASQTSPQPEGAEAEPEATGSDDEAAISDGSLDMLAWVLLPCWLMLCSKVTLSAGSAGQLAAGTGLPWEAYDLLLTCGLALFLTQARSSLRHGKRSIACSRQSPLLTQAKHRYRDN